MRTPKYLLLSVAVCLSVSGCGGPVVKQATYIVVEKQGEFELRQYASQVLAQTTVEGSFDSAGNEGFRRLYKFITGANRDKASIAMTAPVGLKETSRKIPMTVPVSLQQGGGGWVVSFVMPADYTLATTPQPTDSTIELREVPARLAASVTFRGVWSQKKCDERKASLEAFIKEKGLKVEDEPTFAGYDPPWTLWFLRRNEVIIPVSRP
jgi:hypothetical protein